MPPPPCLRWLASCRHPGGALLGAMIARVDNADGRSFVYTADGGNAGVKDVQSGRSQFAVNTRPPLPADAGTTYVKLWLDGLCVYVNSQNKLSNLSIGELAGIFLMSTGAVLFITEFWRDPIGRGTLFHGVLKGPQVAGIVFVLTGAGLLLERASQRIAVEAVPVAPIAPPSVPSDMERPSHG